MGLGILCFIISSVDFVLAAPHYTLTDIAIIPGNTGQIIVNGINGHGDIVGSFESSTNKRAFLWTSEQGLQTLTVPGADRSCAEGINDLGQVVGYARLPASSYNNHAFLWDPSGTVQDIAPTAIEAYAYDINNQGQVVGGVKMSLDRRPYIWTQNGGITQLSNGLGNANAISSNGKVTGGGGPIITSEGAFIWESETSFQYLPDGGGWSRGNAINDNGWVVGFGLLNSTTVPALWTPENGIEYIGETSGGWGYAINNAGTALISTKELGISLWNREEGLTSLTTLLEDLPSNWKLLSATVMNDTGMIAGTAGIDSNHAHLVLLTPIPEPSTLTLLGICIIGLLTYAWRRPYEVRKE